MNKRRSAPLNRRQFLSHTAAVGVAAATPCFITSTALGGEDRPAASPRITMGCIGLGGRGTVNLETFLGQPDVQIVDLAGATNPPDLAKAEIGPSEIHLYESRSQNGNFIDGVKRRARTAAPVETAHRSISVAHLGNIAMQVGRKIRWDPAKEEITGDEEASRLLGRPKREPWRV